MQPKFYKALLAISFAGSLSISLSSVRAADTTTPPAPNSKAIDKKPVVAGAAAKSSAAIASAVKELNTEYEKGRKDNFASLRTSSNYFEPGSTAAADITEDGLIAALGHSLGSSPSSDAYIKWQLISALPATIDVKNLPAALSAYRDAPDVIARPGLTQQEKAALDRLTNGAKGTDVDNFNTQWQKHVDALLVGNGPIAQYRDALFTHLPSGPETAAAGFEDGYDRVSKGIDADELGKSVLSGIHDWSATSPSNNAVENMVRLLDQVKTLIAADSSNITHLADYPRDRVADGLNKVNVVLIKYTAGKSARVAGDFPPSYYDHVEWDEKARHLSWKTARAKFISKNDLEDTRKTVIDLAGSTGAGGLKFKDDTKKKAS